MLLPVHSIIPDPDQPRKLPRKGRSVSTSDDLRTLELRQPLVVRPITDRTGQPDAPAYIIVVGERLWMAARRSGLTDIDGQVRAGIPEQEVRELQLSENYHHEKIPAMQLGRAFLEYREEHSVTQQELARRTSITPGTIHHYESLIRNLDPELGKKVDSGELTFKEARSIADIDDHSRQREIAAPFVSGQLSSVYVERIVGRAKSFPAKSIDDLLDEVVNGAKPAPAPEPAPPVRAPEPVIRQRKDLEGMLLQLAGQLDSLPLQTIPEYRRLKLVSTLRILDSRVQLALHHLSRGPLSGSGMPPALVGAAARR
ncbi:MAG: ParB N-terminal domain-containing protein [Chloroflexi bacterium]|nr:ParB N-terminal domain-containing protein [Chloroflexota bacterium]